jgi:hypothetical protein
MWVIDQARPNGIKDTPNSNLRQFEPLGNKLWYSDICWCNSYCGSVFIVKILATVVHYLLVQYLPWCSVSRRYSRQRFVSSYRYTAGSLQNGIESGNFIRKFIIRQYMQYM